MNAVYIRLALYALSSLLAMIPASWAGFVAYDAAQQVVTVSLPGFVTAIVGALALSGGVFAKWGVK
jgi:hypothetical protein